MRVDDTLDVEIKTVFTPAVASLLAYEVLSAQDLHTTREGFFSTIGATAYLDDPAEYPRLVAEQNPLLLQTFSNIYKQLLRVFPSVLFHPKLGVPGFHIFDHRSNGHHGQIHTDIPYEQVDMPFKGTNPFSFTLCLSAPRVGAGMYYWENLTDDEQAEMYEGGQVESKRELLRYETGKMYTHTGHCPHQIAQLGNMTSAEYRITLQGHGITAPNNQQVVYF